MRAVAKREIQWLPPQPPYWDSSVSPHHCWQLLRHHPDLINESVHWEVENTYTHAPFHTQKHTCVREPRRLTHTEDPPLPPLSRKAAFLVLHKGERLWRRREQAFSKTADLIHPQTDTMWRGKLQEMGRLCPRKDFLQAVNRKRTWKAGTKNTQATGNQQQGPDISRGSSGRHQASLHSPLLRST